MTLTNDPKYDRGVKKLFGAYTEEDGTCVCLYVCDWMCVCSCAVCGEWLSVSSGLFVCKERNDTHLTNAHAQRTEIGS